MSQTTRSNFWTLIFFVFFWPFLFVNYWICPDLTQWFGIFATHPKKHHHVRGHHVINHELVFWCSVFHWAPMMDLLCSIAGFAGFFHIGGYCGSIWFGKHKKQHPMFSEHTQNISKFWLQWISANRATIIDLVSIRVPFGSNSYVWGRRDRTSAVGTS